MASFTVFDIKYFTKMSVPERCVLSSEVLHKAGSTVSLHYSKTCNDSTPHCMTKLYFRATIPFAIFTLHCACDAKTPVTFSQGYHRHILFPSIFSGIPSSRGDIFSGIPSSRGDTWGYILRDIKFCQN